MAECVDLHSDFEHFNVNGHENQRKQLIDVVSVTSEVLEVSQTVIYGAIGEICLTQL
jgi:hypothetical protein